MGPRRSRWSTTAATRGPYQGVHGAPSRSYRPTNSFPWDRFDGVGSRRADAPPGSWDPSDPLDPSCVVRRTAPMSSRSSPRSLAPAVAQVQSSGHRRLQGVSQEQAVASIKVVTDSVSDIPSDLLARYNIDVVPLDVRLGTEGPKELIGITPEEFWRRVRATGAFA